jgi:hypothetical protein
MIILDSTSESLQIVVAESSREIQYTVSYVDVTTTTYTPYGGDGAITVTTDTEIVAAPSASTQRQIKHLTAYNASASPTTVTVKKDISATDRILCKVQLESRETLQYSDGEGFSVINIQGATKKDTVAPIAINAGTQTASSGTIVLSNSNNFTFGMTGTTTATNTGFATVTVSASYSGSLNGSFYERPRANLNAFTVASNSTLVSILNLSLQRFMVPYYMTATRFDLLAALSVGGSRNGTWSIENAIYTRSGSTLSLNTNSSVISGQTWTSAAATSNNSQYSSMYAGVSGTRWRSFNVTTWGFTPGEYWLGIINSCITNQSAMTVSMFGDTGTNMLPDAGQSNDVIGNVGVYSAATGDFPNNMAFSDIVWAHYNTTASARSFPLNQPYFRMYGTH